MPDSSILIRVEPAGGAEPARLDRLLLEALRKQTPHPVSRAQVKTLFAEGRIRENGRGGRSSRVARPSDEVRGPLEIIIEEGDAFLASLSAPLEPAATCFLPILYEDEDLLILDKASGVPSVSHSAQETRTATAAALAQAPELALIGEAKLLEPGLLHRLDTATSGCLAFAKSSAEWARLKSAWQTSEVVKTYRAIVTPVPGKASPRPCTLDLPIGRLVDTAKRVIVLSPSKDPSKGPARAKDLRGKALPALTRVVSARALPENRFDLEIEISTGVMHQIRAHLAHAGWPISGDPLYNPSFRANLNSDPGVPTEIRLLLHAWKLALPLKNGQRLVVEAPLPIVWPCGENPI